MTYVRVRGGMLEPPLPGEPVRHLLLQVVTKLFLCSVLATSTSQGILLVQCTHIIFINIPVKKHSSKSFRIMGLLKSILEPLGWSFDHLPNLDDPST